MQPRCDETSGLSCPYIVGGNGWLCFYTHDVSNDPSEYGSTPAMLAEALDLTAEARLEIVPMRDAVRIALGDDV